MTPERIRAMIRKEVRSLIKSSDFSDVMAIESDPALTVDRAARLSGYSRSWLYNCMSQGTIKAAKAGSRRFIQRSELYRFMGLTQTA